MQEWTNQPGAVWVLGFFDGVHSGHRALLRAARTMAGETGTVGVWTFRTLPKADMLLTTPDERETLLRKAGADTVCFADFDAVCAMSGASFFRAFCQTLRPAGIVCGFNFRFGRGGQSGAAELREWGAAAGISVQVMDAVTEMGETVSSTRIRHLVAQGDVETARALLTYPYTIRGPVLHGKRLGHSIGFPTVNQRIPAGKVAPQNGIYAAQAQFSEHGALRTLPGVCNIGFRPTVNDDKGDITVETYIIGANTELYGETIALSLWKRLRGEIRFSDLSALSAQISEDARATERYFATFLKDDGK